MHAFNAIDVHRWVGSKDHFIQENREKEEAQCEFEITISKVFRQKNDHF